MCVRAAWSVELHLTSFATAACVQVLLGSARCAIAARSVFPSSDLFAVGFACLVRR